MDELIGKFIDHLVMQGFSPQTQRCYETDLRGFAAFCAQLEELESSAQLDISVVNEGHVRAFLLWLRDGKKLKTSTINRQMAALRSFFRYWQSRDIVAVSPAELTPRLKAEQRLPRFLYFEEMQELLAATDDDLLGCRDRAILELLCMCGLRVAEVQNLDIGHIIRENGYIRVLGKGDKERLQPIDRHSLDIIDRYLRLRQQESGEVLSADSPLFLNQRGRRMLDRSYRTMVDQRMEQAALKKHISPHALRHTFATRLLDNGMDILSVKDLLGHQSVSTTQIYTHVSISRIQEVYKHKHPRSGYCEKEEQHGD